MTGRVVDVHAGLDQRVEAGSPLVTLSGEDLELRARLASVRAAEAEAAAAARERAKKKDIALAVEIEESVGLVTGDTRRLGQAVGNVLANAVAYTDAGGRVLLRAEGDAAEARIIVSDNGCGIAPADQARVFDRFHRTVDGRTEDSAAVGLGLPLARQFVEAHGGRIALESRPGEGTTVTISLPRTMAQQADYSAQREAE